MSQIWLVFLFFLLFCFKLKFFQVWWWRVQHYPPPPLLPKIGLLLSPQCAANQCTALSVIIPLLLAPARTEKSRHSCNASCSRKTAMQNGNKSVCWSNFQASPPEPWRGLGTATMEVRSVPIPPTKRSNVSKLFQTAAMGQLFQGASSPILILMCNASFTRRACNEWPMWKYICFQQRSEDTYWHNALFQSPALPSSSPCVSLAPRPSTDLITDWWTCYLLPAVHYSAMRPCLLLSRAGKSFFLGGSANFNFYAAC